METLEHWEDVARLVETWSAAATGNLLIGVEGASASGKIDRGHPTRGPPPGGRVSTDDYGEAGRVDETYAEGVDLPLLQRDLDKLSRTFRLVVVEGICLEETLDAIKDAPARSIYVKRVSSVGVWNDDPISKSWRHLNLARRRERGSSGGHGRTTGGMSLT